MKFPPGWVCAVLAFLALAGVLRRIPHPPGAEVLRRIDELTVERDPRRMNARELRQLPGVGTVLAGAIAGARDGHDRHGPLAWEDVPGIGAVRARDIRAWLVARGSAPDPLAPGTGYPGAMSSLARELAGCVLATLAGCGTASDERAPAAPARTPGHASRVSLRALELDVAGGVVHALEAGPAGGPGVLLLHGARFTSETWRELGTLAQLARSGCHVLAFDWPGFGASPAFAIEPDATELLASVLARAGLERAVLVAPSMSGSFAFELLEQPGAPVSALVAVAPLGCDTFAPPLPWTVPTLLLWGDRDEVLSPDLGRELCARLPGTRIELFPGAGHACYLEQPELFHERLLRFLAEVHATAR